MSQPTEKSQKRFKDFTEGLFIALIAALFLFINIGLVNGNKYDSYDIGYSCIDDICLEGETATWIVTIYNKGNSH